MIRTIIVDDEPLARDGLRARLEHHPDIEVVAEAGDGIEAVATISRMRPDLVFLDIQIPGCSGLDVVEQVAESHLPTFIFVTAFDGYALQAFEAHALDYLLKPYGAERFEQAVSRARREIERAEQLERHQRLLGLLDARAKESHAASALSADQRLLKLRFTVKDGDRYVLVAAQEVDWVESAANYVKIHARGSTFMMRATMTEMEQQLDPRLFARIHRTTIVNIDRVKEIHPEWHGDFDVLLRDGTTLRMSRGYRTRLLQ